MSGRPPNLSLRPLPSLLLVILLSIDLDSGTGCLWPWGEEEPPGPVSHTSYQPINQESLGRPATHTGELTRGTARLNYRAGCLRGDTERPAHHQLTPLGTKNRLLEGNAQLHSPFSPLKHLLQCDLISHLTSTASRAVFPAQVLRLAFQALPAWSPPAFRDGPHHLSSEHPRSLAIP